MRVEEHRLQETSTITRSPESASAAGLPTDLPVSHSGGGGDPEARAGNYHAFTTRLERRYSKGMTFLVNYTFSKTLTDVDGSR